MAIQRTFTGENTGIKIQPLDRVSRSQERMDDMLTKADQIRFSTFKENQNKFLNAMNVDMETYLSTANAEAQSKLIDEYNNKAQALLKSRGGRFENLTTQDWVELQKGRKYIESAQAKMNTDLERFKMDEQLMKRDGGRNYDPDEWNNIKKTYLQTGVYSEDPLPVKEKAFEGYLSQRSKNYTDKLQAELETTAIGGIKQKRTAWVNMTPEQAREEIKQGILLNDGERKNVMKRFAALPVQEQAKWLDTNRDGKVDKTEQGDENGIIAWAQQYQPFLSALIKEDTSMYSNVSQPSKPSTGSQFEFNLGTGNPTKYAPTEAMATTLGNTSYETYHPLPQFETYYIPAENVELLNVTGNTEKTTNKTLKVQPTGYDEKRDEFTFTILQDYKSGNRRGSGDQVAIKSDKLPQKFKEIYVLVNGKPTMIKDIQAKKATTTATTTAQSTPKKKAY